MEDESLEYGVCRVCGCTDNNPCYNPNHGNCWWADETHTICSHCADETISKDRSTKHCINNSMAKFSIAVKGMSKYGLQNGTIVLNPEERMWFDGLMEALLYLEDNRMSLEKDIAELGLQEAELCLLRQKDL